MRAASPTPMVNYSISNTAEWGEYVSGPRIITSETKAEMKRVLNDIQTGKFTSDWMQEYRAGASRFKGIRRMNDAHQIEAVGEKLRGMIDALLDRQEQAGRQAPAIELGARSSSPLLKLINKTKRAPPSRSAPYLYTPRSQKERWFVPTQCLVPWQRRRPPWPRGSPSCRSIC